MVDRRTAEKNLGTLCMPYPGRIVAVGLTPDGKRWQLFTGMGGKSADSNNRVYKAYPDLVSDGEYVRTAVYDPSKSAGDASATIYTAHRAKGGWHVASNGEQTDGILVALNILGFNGFEAGQRFYQHEGPQNRNTSRLTAAVYNDPRVNGEAQIGKILVDPKNESESIYRWYPLAPLPGEGYLVTTYKGDGSYEPNRRVPILIPIADHLEETTEMIWRAWSTPNKAGLCGKEVELGSNRFKYSFRSVHLGLS